MKLLLVNFALAFLATVAHAESYFNLRALTWKEEAFRTLCREAGNGLNSQQIAEVVRTTLAQNFASDGSFFIVVDNTANATIGSAVTGNAEEIFFPPICNDFFMHVGVTKAACSGQIDTSYLNQYLNSTLTGAVLDDVQMLADTIADADSKLGIDGQVVTVASADAGFSNSGDSKCVVPATVSGAVSYTMYGLPITTDDNFETITHKYVCNKVQEDPTVTNDALASQMLTLLLNSQGGNDWIVAVNTPADMGIDSYTLATWTMTAKSQNFCGKDIYIAGRKSNPTDCLPGFPSQALTTLISGVAKTATNITELVSDVNMYADAMDLTSQLIVAVNGTDAGFNRYDDLSCSLVVKEDPWTVYYYGYPNN